MKKTKAIHSVAINFKHKHLQAATNSQQSRYLIDAHLCVCICVHHISASHWVASIHTAHHRWRRMLLFLLHLLRRLLLRLLSDQMLALYERAASFLMFCKRLWQLKVLARAPAPPLKQCKLALLPARPATVMECLLLLLPAIAQLDFPTDWLPFG